MYASGRRKRPRGPRPKAELVVNVSPSPSRDVRSEAVAHYIHYHLNHRNSEFTLQGKIREVIVSTCTSNQALESALSAMSTAIFSKVKSQPHAAAQASASYQKSLQRLQATLGDMCATEIDTCLLTIGFLARYEDSMFSPSSNTQSVRLRMPSGHLHLIGATACLKYWLDCSGNFQAPTCIITQTRRNLRKAALFGQFDLPDWLEDGVLYGEYGSDLELDHILIRIIRIRRRASCLMEDETASLPLQQVISTLYTLCEEALNIDTALLRWMNLFSANEDRIKHKLTDNCVWSRNSFYHSCVYIYQGQSQAATLIQCYGYRMLINHLLISMFGFMGSYSKHLNDGKLSQCRNNMSQLAYDMASSVPFCLARFTVSNDLGSSDNDIIITNHQDAEPHVAEQIATPVAIAATTKYIDAAYTSWFSSQLANIGRLTGYGLIEHVATSSRFKL